MGGDSSRPPLRGGLDPKRTNSESRRGGADAVNTSGLVRDRSSRRA